MANEPDMKKLKTSDESPPCKYFLQRKKRYCRMTVKQGNEFCGEHLTIVQKASPLPPDADSARMPCPLDPKHSVYVKNLNKHLSICNARPCDEAPPYIKKDINRGAPVDDPLPEVKLATLSEARLKEIVTKVDGLYEANVENQIDRMVLEHEVLREEIANPAYGESTLKHLVQTASIIGILDNLMLLQPRTCFVEFGAGKGQVSYYLARATARLEATKMLLIDRASLRHKKDNKLEDRESVRRVRADIADLDLSQLDLLEDCERLVGVGKHLCGAATDLALRCIVNGNNETTKRQTKGVLIALCCHHRCTWREFVGKEWLKANGIDQSEFNVMTKMASWGVCGTGLSRERRKEIEENPDLLKSTLDRHKLTREERQQIGLRCKRVLDHARKVYLEENNFICDFRFYVDAETTLENVCLVGKLRGLATDSNKDVQ